MAQFDIEITPPDLPIAANSGSHEVRRLQEWLVVRGLNIGANPGAPSSSPAAAGIDGGFGAGTQAGCDAFAEANGLANGAVDMAFWQALTGGMEAAFTFRSARSAIGDAVMETARMHLAQKPIEARRLVNGRLIGQDNTGPWVRLLLRRIGRVVPGGRLAMGKASLCCAQPAASVPARCP
jgi:hypothetical protein